MRFVQPGAPLIGYRLLLFKSGVILAHTSVIVKGKTCRSHTFVESHSFYGSELEKQPSFCVFLFACQLFAHPFQIFVRGAISVPG